VPAILPALCELVCVCEEWPVLCVGKLTWGCVCVLCVCVCREPNLLFCRVVSLLNKVVVVAGELECGGEESNSIGGLGDSSGW
jgi:hypothetical protein